MMRQPTSEKTHAEDANQARNTFLIATLLAFAHFVAVSYYIYVIRTTGAKEFYTLAAISSALGVLFGLSALLSKRGRANLGAILALVALAVSYPPIATLVVGLGLTIGPALSFAGPMIAFQVLPRKSARVLTVVTVAAGITATLLDIFGSPTRPALPGSVIQILAVAVIAILGYFIFRQFRDFPLRTKIIFGILLIEGLSVGVLAYFALTRADQIVASLSGKFENSVQMQTEAELTNLVNSEANDADQLFSTTKDSLLRLTDYRTQLESNTTVMNQSSYWDSHTKLSQLPGGQYGNPASDVASVFLPEFMTVDEKVLAELNTSAFLDFLAPGILTAQPQIVAIYYISELGSTTYYPNIHLSTLVPPDFDAQSQSFYTVAAPSENPERILRWTEPYQDPAASGLIVTASAPVYSAKGVFKGVMGIDLQLARISEKISQIKAGETGFAFIVDETGHILTMPPQGYAIFGLEPEEVPVNESPKETILGHGSADLQAVASRLVGGESGLAKVMIGGRETYIAFAPLNTPGYSLGVIVPASELQMAIVTSQQEVRSETASALQTATFILIGLLAGAVLLSLGMGQIIAAPLTNLIQTAEQISAGDLSARATIASKDETGTLANAFNRMNDRLSETLSGLEQRVAARTKDLATVAAISTQTTAIRDPHQMLATMVHLTQRGFGLYHAHVFTYHKEIEELQIVACGYQEGDEHEGTHGTTSIPLSQEQSLVARAARTRKPVIVNDVRSDPGWLPNPLLPETHAEMAVPMIVGDELLGVLDVQADHRDAFTEEDANIQTTLASQIATSYQSSLAYEQSREQADLESLINSIGQKIQRSVSVEDTLQTAIREVGLALGASRVSANITSQQAVDHHIGQN